MKATRAACHYLHDMPNQNSKTTFHRMFTEKQQELIFRGYIPEGMDDKWFIFYEDGKIYFHRSWTGYCIYIIRVDFDAGIHEVTINTKQTRFKSLDEATDLLTGLFDNILFSTENNFA